MDSIKERIDYCNKAISGKATKLIGVTKTVSIENIKKAYECGLRDFGENKVQELLSKINALPSSIRWHFIGHLQSNKVPALLKNNIYLIHSVDSLKLASFIDKYAAQNGKVQNVLLEVNVTGEESKSGYRGEEALFGDMKALLELKNIKIMGLMCVAQKGENATQFFNKLSALKEKINKTFDVGFTELSMGMTDDYLEAINCGSTYIRIGRGIFGERKYPAN